MRQRSVRAVRVDSANVLVSLEGLALEDLALLDRLGCVLGSAARRGGARGLAAPAAVGSFIRVRPPRRVGSIPVDRSVVRRVVSVPVDRSVARRVVSIPVDRSVARRVGSIPVAEG